jgi:tetratricopeptide (TPR) repeat protein
MLRYYSDQLARVYVSEHKNDQVEQLFKRAVELANQLPGKDKTFVVPNTLAGLAQLYECEGRFADAEVALKQRIEMRHRFMNAGQIDPALVDLANLYTHWGKFDQARPLFEQLRTISPMPVAVRQGYSDFIAVSKGAPANQAAN